VLVIVQPDILKHGKYRTLRASLGGPVALEVLLALWSHVQTSSSRNPDLILDDAEEIALICGYRGNAKRLKDALMYVPTGYTHGFLVQSEVVGMVRVYAWTDINRELIKRRENGKLGGRPRGNRSETYRITGDITGAEPTGHPSRVEESRVDIPPTPQGVGEGDEAHRILTGSGNLRGVTWEQDLRLRQCRADIRDWVTVAREVAAIAEDYTNGIDQPVVWLRKVFGNWGRNEKLKNGAPEAGSDARKNVFRGYSDADEPKPKGWVPPSQRGKA
jgi:hypothetical protein